MLHDYIVASDMQTDELSVITREKYEKENKKHFQFKYEPIDGADTKDEADKILAHIQELGGVQNYFTEIMDKGNMHIVQAKERTVVSIVDKFPDGYVRVRQLENNLYKIMDDDSTEPEDAVMETLKRNIKFKRCNEEESL